MTDTVNGLCFVCQLPKLEGHEHKCMDEATRHHFERWLAQEYSEDVRDECREIMLREYVQDREYYDNHGWPKLRDRCWIELREVLR